MALAVGIVGLELNPATAGEGKVEEVAIAAYSAYLDGTYGGCRSYGEWTYVHILARTDGTPFSISRPHWEPPTAIGVDENGMRGRSKYLGIVCNDGNPSLAGEMAALAAAQPAGGPRDVTTGECLDRGGYRYVHIFQRNDGTTYSRSTYVKMHQEFSDPSHPQYNPRYLGVACNDLADCHAGEREAIRKVRPTHSQWDGWKLEDYSAWLLDRLPPPPPPPEEPC